MMSIQVTRKTTFQKPTVSAKAYVSVGASGWPEVFQRSKADKELEAFVGPLALDELLVNFQEWVDLKRDGKIGWHDIMSYLGRIKEIDPDKISSYVGIAFWAHLLVNKNK